MDHHLDLPGDQVAVALPQPDPGRAGHPQRGVGSGPAAQADQGRVLLPQPGASRSAWCSLTDRYGRTTTTRTTSSSPAVTLSQCSPGRG